MSETPWEHILNKLRNPNEPENKELTNWLAEKPENKENFEDIKVIYSLTGNVPDSFVPRKAQAWQKVESRISVPKHRVGTFRILTQIAASFLLIALGVGGTLYLQKNTAGNSYTEVFSPYGHKTMVLLPDSSQVWLNGNSRLKYHTNFTSSRNVEVTGEALFKVHKNPDKLFSVNSKSLHLEVYGTTFNVKSYPEDLLAEVALVEGSIGLFRDKQLLKKMIPGEVITYNATENKYSSIQGNINQITSWRADELVIENEAFEEVVKYLERWYGVEITLEESLKNNFKLSFKVKTESLTELLSIINHITPVDYEIDGKRVKILKKIRNN